MLSCPSSGGARANANRGRATAFMRVECAAQGGGTPRGRLAGALRHDGRQPGGPLMSVQVIARLRLAVIALVGCLALGLTGAARASAEETVTFNYTGGEQEFKVPAGVTSVHVVAVGSEGGTDPGAARGGKGTVVRGDLSVSPGEVLYVEVGGVPFNGGGSSSLLEEGGKGGGASDVRTVSIGTEPSPGNEASLNSRLLVAGGGGGGGANWSAFEVTCAGGAGGGAEENGTDGTSCGF